MNEQETILADIKKAVLSVDETADVLLFGSRARGDFHEESDWDVLILTNEHITWDLRNHFYSVIFDIEYKHMICIGIIMRTRVEWNTSLYINVYEDGIVL